MADKKDRAVSAYERLEEAVAMSHLSAESPIRRIALRTLTQLRQQIDTDPTFVEDLIRQVTRLTRAPIIEST
jgi:hypothetical protein